MQFTPKRHSGGQLVVLILSLSLVVSAIVTAVLTAGAGATALAPGAGESGNHQTEVIFPPSSSACSGEVFQGAVITEAGEIERGVLLGGPHGP